MAIRRSARAKEMSAIRSTSLFLAALLISVITAERSYGCVCGWEGPFLKVAPKSIAIVRVRVLSHRRYQGSLPIEMQVEVLEVMAGQSRTKRLRVAGDNGNLCRPYVTEFPVGTEWVLGLDKAAEIDAGADYSINACGTYWLKVLGELVEGNVDDEKRMDARQRVPLEALRLNFAEKFESLPSTDILCIVRPAATSEKAGPIPVTVTVQNRSNRRLNLSVHPVLELRPSSGAAYWAPFDFQSSPSPRGANSSCTLKLPPGASVETEIKLDTLLWDSVFSSIWPSHPLTSVPPGSYALTFTIEVVSQERGRRITSKPIRFVIP
jgi:hypothetical protein